MGEEAEVVAEEVSRETPEVVVETPEVVEVDLSSVPEAAREFVDSEKYESNESYKQALDHGWKPKELFAADGGDADGHEGFKTFNRIFDTRQKAKESNAKFDELSSQIASVSDILVKEQMDKLQGTIDTTQSQLDQAIEDGDADLAAKLAESKGVLENQKALESQAPPQQGESQTIVTFRQSNPMLDSNSPDYNPSVNAVVENMVNQQIAKASNNGAIQLPEETVNYILDASFKRVKDDLNLNKKPTKRAPNVAQTVASAVPTGNPKSLLTAGELKMYHVIEGNSSKYGADAATKAADEYAAKIVANRTGV